MRRFCQLPTFGALLAALAALCVHPISAQTVPPSGKGERTKPWLDSVRESAIDRLFSPPPNSPGYAVALIKDDEFVFASGYGLANLDDGVPITRMTSFHLASLSKQFTAAAVALLILDHRIALSDPVAKYLPDVSKYGNGLRIEHLVYMTSGLHEYTDEPRINGAPWMTFYYFTRDEAIAAALKPDQLEFAPGTKWAYRNLNYMLLTKIVEAASHESFAAFMHDRVFVPLGMSHSEINDDSTEVIPHRATGYALRSDPRVLKELAQVGVVIKPGDGWARLVRVAPHFGGSGVFTTLNDLLLWDRNWYAGTLAGPQFTELMNKRLKFEHDKDNDAMGLVWRSSYGHPMLDYSGGDTDSSTYMARFPEQHFTIVCLSNMPLGDAEGKAHAVLELLHGWGKL
ncbi:MAG TPA: serine hydrolase domain-containing protein [Bryobacteraceae bacterium]|nr:serine hydrolase domain-containing protein [Bryobacteraceae bacterium]